MREEEQSKEDSKLANARLCCLSAHTSCYPLQLGKSFQPMFCPFPIDLFIWAFPRLTKNKKENFVRPKKWK